MQRLVIIGGGIIGLATALKAARHKVAREVVLLEKDSSTGGHQSSHNSGVLHCGLYYKPGSLKAKLAVEGIREMVAFCGEHRIPHDICGKIVLAVDEPIRATRCEAHGSAKGCMLAGERCITHNLWEDLGDEIHRYLAGVSLEDVVMNRTSSRHRRASQTPALEAAE